MENDRFKRIFFCLFKQKVKKLEFSFDPGEHSLQVSAKFIKGSGCGVEWVKSKRYTYEETCTLLQETVQIVHSRPI